MVTPELADYIKAELARGVLKDDLKQALISAGWPAPDVEQVINPDAARPVPSSPEMDMAALFGVDSSPSESAANKFQAIKQKLSMLKEKFAIDGSNMSRKKIVVSCAVFLFVCGAAATGFFFRKAANGVASVPVVVNRVVSPPITPEEVNPVAQSSAAKKEEAPKQTAEVSKSKSVAKKAETMLTKAVVQEPFEAPQESAESMSSIKGNPGLDTDGDGIDDEMEAMIGTSPRKRDSDGDGVADGVEVKRGDDPTSPN